jgi:hypothetical protein
MYQIVTVVLLSGSLVVTGVGCANTNARMCQQTEEAEFCLTKDGPAFKASGRGFQPGSPVNMVTDDGRDDAGVEPGPSTLRAGEDGEVPSPSGTAGVLTGPRPQQVVVTGTSTSGRPVRFEFTVPAFKA